MNGYTHLAGGVLAGCIVVYFTGASEPLQLILAASCFGALLPDIDNPQSTIQRYVPGVGKIIGRLLKHRGITHSLFFVGLLVAGLKMTPISWTYVLSFTAGMISHLVLDTFNPKGVPWLWPLLGRLSLPLVNSSGLLEMILIMPAMTGIAAYTVWLVY